MDHGRAQPVSEDWGEAIASCSRLLDILRDARRPYIGIAMEARLGRGRLRLRIKDYDRAIEDFAVAQELWPWRSAGHSCARPRRLRRCRFARFSAAFR